MLLSCMIKAFEGNICHKLEDILKNICILTSFCIMAQEPLVLAFDFI